MYLWMHECNYTLNVWHGTFSLQEIRNLMTKLQKTWKRDPENNAILFRDPNFKLFGLLLGSQTGIFFFIKQTKKCELLCKNNFVWKILHSCLIFFVFSWKVIAKKISLIFFLLISPRRVLIWQFSPNFFTENLKHGELLHVKSLLNTKKKYFFKKKVLVYFPLYGNRYIRK